MATLQSPGVQVTVIDESFYTPAAPGTVPLIFVATAQDKANASGTGTAQGTLAANAGKVWAITSQRDLTDTFGTPIFRTDASGNPVHGGELNEYGLQAAYSVLGASSKAYIVRADMDLSQLVSSTSIPEGKPVPGTYWVDTSASAFGVFEWSNAGKGSFTKKTPLVINNDDVNNPQVINTSTMVPFDGFGNQGDYAMVVTSDNESKLYFKTTTTTNAWSLVEEGFNGGKKVTVSPHYQYPTYTTATNSGSVWVKTTTPGSGAHWSVKYYNGSTSQWGTVNAPVYNSTRQALEKLDYAGGGKNIPIGSVFIESNYNHSTNTVANFKLWRRSAVSPTTISLVGSTYTNAFGGGAFAIRETLKSSTDWSAPKTVTLSLQPTDVLVEKVSAAINTAGFVNISATYDTVAKKLTISHALGGDFEINDVAGLLASAGFQAYNVDDKSGTANLYAAPTGDTGYTWLATNWKPLKFEATKVAPFTVPADGTLWYDANFTNVDIMVNDGTKWVGYKNYTGYSNTDPNGPIVAALAPTSQSEGGDLVDGDVWISTANPENYGKDIYVYNGSTLKWDLQDVADNASPSGWVFADARSGTTGGTADPAKAPSGTIKDLLSSNYVDPDAPDPAMYPMGIKLWNLRRSGYNIKKYVRSHIDVTANEGMNKRYQDESMSNYFTDRWISVSPNNANGSGSFGRKAQRAFVVKGLKEVIDANVAVRDTDTLVFNLIACPGYPELIANMIGLNTDRGQTAFVVGDTPFRLEPNATKLSNWGNNTAGALDNGDEGAVSYDAYMAMFYPSGYTTDNTGNNIVVPASHMMLRTMINSDAKSYQWFAPAGLRRGGVDNATSVGYIEAATGEFKTTALYEGLRNVLAGVKVNAIATLPGSGIVNMGQYTRYGAASALDRINVARLVAFLRRQLAILAKPFLFEPNDAQTRREIKAAADSLLLELVGQRALYDFLTVCDTSNNTPARIDRSELYMDIAIEPVKAVEFIYIPLRIKNTGEIAAGL